MFLYKLYDLHTEQPNSMDITAMLISFVKPLTECFLIHMFSQHEEGNESGF